MSEQQNQPWERMTGESSLAYAAFNAYLGLGPERTCLRAYLSVHPDSGARRTPTNWYMWCNRFQWVKRAQAYDDYQLGLVRSREEAALVAEVDRRLSQEIADVAIEEDAALIFEAARALVKRARQILTDDDPEALHALMAEVDAQARRVVVGERSPSTQTGY